MKGIPTPRRQARPIQSFGFLPSPPDVRDFQISYYLPPIILPAKISYRNLMTLIKYQGGLGSCVAFAATALNEGLHDEGDLSEMWLYDKCKRSDGMPDQQGTFPRVALAAIRAEGICEEVYWRYLDRYPPETTPIPGADINALNYRIYTYASVHADELKAALVTHGPLLMGFMVYENYLLAQETGVIPAPKGAQVAGHAVCLTGFDDEMERFEFKNSWSWAWGDGGYGYFPYPVVKQVFLEAWSVVDEKQIPPRWPDLPEMSEEDLIAQDRVWQTGIMRGYNDGLFWPGIPVSRHQVGTVMVRLGLMSKNPWEKEADYIEPATRGWVHEKMPDLVFLEWNRWDEPLLRFQLMLLVGRALLGIARIERRV